MSLDKGGFGNHPAFAGGPVAAAPPTVVPMGFSMPVYWPGDHIVCLKYDNVEYFLNPQSVNQIHGTFQHQRDEQKGHLLFDRAPVRKLGPDQIIEGLISLYGVMGLRQLTGNPVVDERIKIEARKTYIPWRVAECETIVANHEADCAMAVAAKRRPPRPSASWRQAKIDLDAFERFSVDGKRFVCSKDGMDFDTEGEALQWAAENYLGLDPKTIIIDTRMNEPKPAEGVATPAAEVPAVVKVTAGHEEVDVLNAQKQAIFMQAGMEGISLPADLLEGLRSDDPEIVALAIEEANRLLNG